MPLNDLKAVMGRKPYKVGDIFCAGFFWPKYTFSTLKCYANDSLVFLADILIND